MDVLTTALLALGLSADAFAVAASKGAALRRPHPREALRTGFIFGVTEAALTLLGWGLGIVARKPVEAYDHWLALVLLGGLGVRMLVQAARAPREDVARPRRHGLSALLIAAVGSSLDALTVGVTLAFVDANIWITALVIGLCAFACAALGMLFGRALGRRVGRAAEAIGGLVLIGIGIYIVLEHTGVLTPLV